MAIVRNQLEQVLFTHWLKPSTTRWVALSNTKLQTPNSKHLHLWLSGDAQHMNLSRWPWMSTLADSPEETINCYLDIVILHLYTSRDSRINYIDISCAQRGAIQWRVLCKMVTNNVRTWNLDDFGGSTWIVSNLWIHFRGAVQKDNASIFPYLHVYVQNETHFLLCFLDLASKKCWCSKYGYQMPVDAVGTILCTK